PGSGGREDVVSGPPRSVWDRREPVHRGIVAAQTRMGPAAPRRRVTKLEQRWAIVVGAWTQRRAQPNNWQLIANSVYFVGHEQDRQREGLGSLRLALRPRGPGD